MTASLSSHARLLLASTLAIGAALAPALPARAAELPSSPLTLFERLPDAPESPADATRWFDKARTLIHPGLLALKADYEAHLQALAQLRQQHAERSRGQGELATHNLARGMADIGIDMERMQRDPAYAAQVQERMRKMSPQEMIAMSQRMSQPLNQDKRYVNEARAKAEDAAAVRAAAEAGQGYMQAVPARSESLARLMREADAEIERINSKPLNIPASKPAMDWQNIGCDAGCRARWDSYADAAAPLMIARAGEALRIRRAALRRQRELLAEGMRNADRHLVASRWGIGAKSADNQQLILGYDESAAGKLPYLIEQLENASLAAASMVHCARHWARAPGTVCEW